jgi:hypothetical protein
MLAEYPSDSPGRYRGICLWYHLRMEEDQLWEHRDCADFVQRIPDVDAMGHYTYKVSRDNLGSAYRISTSARRRANLGLVISLLGIAAALLAR